MADFKTYEADGSQVRARISDGDEQVSTLSGVVSVDKGSAVIERPDQASVYDVLSADQWKDTGYGKGSSGTAQTDNKGGK